MCLAALCVGLIMLDVWLEKPRPRREIYWRQMPAIWEAK